MANNNHTNGHTWEATHIFYRDIVNMIGASDASPILLLKCKFCHDTRVLQGEALLKG